MDQEFPRQRECIQVRRLKKEKSRMLVQDRKLLHGLTSRIKHFVYCRQHPSLLWRHRALQLSSMATSCDERSWTSLLGC